MEKIKAVFTDFLYIASIQNLVFIFLIACFKFCLTIQILIFIYKFYLNICFWQWQSTEKKK